MSAVRARRLYDCAVDAPQRTEPQGSRTWLIATANFVVAMTRIDGDELLAREDQPDEYMAVVSPGLQALAIAGDEQRSTEGDALFIVPPGRSELRVSGQGLVTRVFSRRAADLMAEAVNHLDYAQPVAGVEAMVPWPAPVGGFRLRHYALPEHARAANGISRVFRSTNLMLNVMNPYDAPRDPKVLKPHSHVDCEQITVCAEGDFVHHLRTPWAVDSTQWREDEHLGVPSPSALVIPNRLIHTTQAMAAGCRLIDVFGPPRHDFSSMPGFVCNADEYPMPGTVG